MNNPFLKLLVISLLFIFLECHAENKKREWDQRDLAIVQALLASYNSNTPKITEEFCKAYFSEEMLSVFPMERHLKEAHGVFQDDGVLNFHSMLHLKINSDHYTLSLLATSEETEVWVKVRIFLSTDSNRKIVGLHILPAKYKDIPYPKKSISIRKLKKS